MVGMSGMLLVVAVLSGCMRYLTHNREEVLLDGVDVDATLRVAEHELKRGKLGEALTLWALRDQVITPLQSESVNRLYFEYIDSLGRFDQWHLTWAIADIYRQGDTSVQDVISRAYFDAKWRAERLHRLANRMVNDEKLYMGDAHFLGRAYAKNHLVVPGNKKYLQSYDEFMEKRKKE